MLLRRVITALCLAAFALAAIFLLPTWGFAVTFGVAAGAGVYEWSGFLRVPNKALRIGYVAIYAALIGLIFVSEGLYSPIIQTVGVVWLGAIVLVLVYPRGRSLYTRSWLIGLVGQLLMVGAWCSLMAIREMPSGQYWLLWLLVLTTATDVGAFFSGRALGRRKLAPSLSPGKTWEGAFGGLLLASSMCLTALFVFSEWSIFAALILTIGLIVVAVFGDLFESLLKRATGLKDSGGLLPGHGGVLDRIDSIIAVLPLLAWALLT
ncbi:MAG TPA: phosphatidate cytidylyltransferase [Gammaproteobacteria bacterium]|nr:phosphatidate cytidylyltransferase [Gammaproteobacteria bacterium]